MTKLFKNILVLLLSISLLTVIAIFSILWTFSNNIPDYKFLKNYKPPVSSKMYSGDGDLVADFSKEKRIFVPYSAIPSNVINAFLSAEDKNFFTHPGVDAKGVLRATFNNITNIMTSKRLEGASTITQQVAKNFLLTNEVSIDRKIKEAILAFRIERVLSKKRILELYLNQIYLGEGSYGIASASLRYFNKPISELNYAEAALLAALPKAPSKYNPYKNIDLAKFRRNLVLNNLFENKWCVLIKDKKTNLKHLNFLNSFWKKMGSKVVFMNSEKHDKIFSITSHLPHLIAYNLVKSAQDFEKKQKYNLIKYSAGGLRDFSRIAASNEIMWRDIFFNNKNNISNNTSFESSH